MAVLSVLLVRLWTMQVISGSEYAAQAESNRVREVTTVAPRGRILDRHGKVLVGNRPTLAVVAPAAVASDTALLSRLSALLDVPAADIKERVGTRKEAALALRVVAVDVPMDVVAYLTEHESQFPGVEVQTRAVREYPDGALAAHVLGYTGEISENEMASPEFAAYDPTDVVGKAGAERAFESVLQGDRGVRTLEVDASGRPRRVIGETAPEPGRDVVLTIDAKVQKVAESALAQAMQDAHRAGYYKAKSGAAVALDLRSGEVLAMASAPTYDPTVFLGGVSTGEWRSLTSTESEYPLTNRAIMAQYPAASTFKAFTGLAGLQRGITRQWTTYQCRGRWTGMGRQWAKWCWNHAGHGTESFMAGIRDSCDTVFYEIGYAFYKRHDESLQKFVRGFGFGAQTGIDLPGETDGRVPDAKWKRNYNEDYPEYRRWLPGDTVNMAIGQGDLLVTPLQIAATYGGIANGGEVMKPHVLKKVLDSGGKPVLQAEPQVAFRPDVSDANLGIMRTALRSVITQGTARAVFRGMVTPVAGKTGTAQVAGKDDYAWFVGYAPADHPKYVVAVVVEQGGHGGSVAGPAARQILSALLGERITHVTATDSSR
jgi:penicillin-binding protein 2